MLGGCRSPVSKRGAHLATLGRGHREGKDIPKVLAALGVSLDVEVATDLLRSPDIFMDIHAAIEVVVLPLPTDIFSLLYVVGRGRGLEPD